MVAMVCSLIGIIFRWFFTISKYCSISNLEKYSSSAVLRSKSLVDISAKKPYFLVSLTISAASIFSNLSVFEKLLIFTCLAVSSL